MKTKCGLFPSGNCQIIAYMIMYIKIYGQASVWKQLEKNNSGNVFTKGSYDVDWLDSKQNVLL